MRPTLSIACCFALLAGLITAAHGQSFGRSNASAFGSGTGSSGLGGSSMGSSGFGGSGFGSSSFGSGGFGGSGAFGSGGFGGNSFGSSGMGGSGMGSSGLGGGGLGAGGYGGGQQNFVGRDSTDMANVWSQMGNAGTQFFNQMNRGMGRNMGNNADRGDNSATAIENEPQPMLIKLQVAFDVPAPSPAQLTSNIRARVGRSLAAQNIAAPQITMEGETAVLRGVAATESQRLVLEKLVSLEPGVREVRNEITVVPPTAPALNPATGN